MEWGGLHHLLLTIGWEGAGWGQRLSDVTRGPQLFSYFHSAILSMLAFILTFVLSKYKTFFMKPCPGTSKLIILGVPYSACVLNSFSDVQLFVNLWTIASQAPLSLGFSRQEY